MQDNFCANRYTAQQNCEKKALKKLRQTFEIFLSNDFDFYIVKMTFNLYNQKYYLLKIFANLFF